MTEDEKTAATAATPAPEKITEKAPGKAPEKAAAKTADKVPEIGGPKGPEPTRFGDWERNGICVDF